MKKVFALAAFVAGLAAVGCTSTGTSTTSSDRKWTADPDRPPAIQKNTRTTAGAPEAELPKLPPSQTKVSPEDIDEANVKEMARKLESELKFDGRAVSQK